ncbi:ABC transporter ATP-binding protein [Ruminococcaceae bacterium OttesenSCG-928-A11]|nr:ABC transporter ATP-binding protein [Ruminococcaceae bacterium OttesenSCG-928-A11]
MAKLLEIDNLHVHYKTDEENVYALNGVSLSLDEGETLGLVGETGAGKSTIALSIMKLLPEKVGFISEGSLSFDGKNLLAATEADMRAMRGNDMSMIFADPMSALNPIHTVGDQIREVVELHFPDMKRDEMEQKVDEMMEMVGIPASRKDEYPHQFSGGMKQRIVIAIALACTPRLLLADEPTTALDVTIQAQVLKMISDLKEKINTAMLLITHDLGVVAQVCNRVAIIYAGEIVESGRVEDIFDKEDRHPYTNRLFGSIPDLISKTARLTPIDGLMPDPTQQPVGCRFADRCPECMDICTKEAPGAWVDGTHAVRCHLFFKADKAGGQKA